MTYQFDHKTLKAIRLKHRESLRGFARLAGVSRQAILQWERGVNTPTVSSLQTLCNNLGIKPEVFFKEDHQ